MAIRFLFMTAAVFCAAWIWSCGSVSVSNLDPTNFSSISGSGPDCTSKAATFSANVVPIFSSRNCTNTGCHGGGSTAGNLSLEGGAAVVYPAVSSRANPSAPASSLILMKPVGGVTHGGGKIFASTQDNDYETIFCWISAGAAND